MSNASTVLLEKAEKHSKRTQEIASSSLSKLPDNLAIMVLIVVFIYAAIRAYCLSLTHDEAITFLNHARGSFFDIFTYQGDIPSNSHLFNTFLIKIFTNIFGISEFVIRAPALIGLGLYLIGIYKILTLFLKKYSLFLGICLLTWHPLILDLSSCARGYSLALGFMILGLYYFLKSITCRTIGSAPPSYILASIMFALSALSQFLFVNIYISMVGVYVLFELIILIQMKNFFHLGALYDAGKNILFGIFPSFILLLIFCSYPAMKLTRGNEGFWGGNNGFWRDTVGTLIVRTLNESFINSDIILFSKAVIIATLFLAFLIIICDMIRNRALSPTDKYCICMLLLILISSLGIVTQHYLLNIPYPFDRYALYLIPTFFLIILLFLPNIKFIGNQFIRTSVDIVTRFLIVCLLLMFIGQTSFTHFIQWKYDASTKNVMDDIIAMNRNKTLPDDSVSLGINWLFEPSTNYYILKNNISWIRKTDRSGPVGKFDYYYVTPEYKNFLDKNNIKIIRQYETTGNYLAVSNPR